MAPLVPFTVVDVEWGWPNQPVLYRIRAPAGATGGPRLSPVIRYLSASNRPKGASGIPDNRNEFLAFDAVPAGAWNIGHLVPDGSVDGKFVLASTETAEVEAALGLREAGPAWCHRKVDIDDLMDLFYARRRGDQADDNQDGVEQRMTMTTDIQCMNQVYAEVLPTPADIAAAAPGPEVIGIWAWQPGHSHGMAAESHAYSIIQARDPGLAPRFLGHITENGTRIIGFLLERIVGAREAGPADLEKCTAALSRLHALGIAYGGPLRRHSFLVCGSSSSGDAVLLQGFGGSFETTDKEVLGRELEGLELVLSQPSELERFNGPVDMKRSDLMMEFLSHGLIHPFVVFQLGSSGSITVTAEQHKEMVAELAANDYNWTEEDMERAKQRFGGSADAAGVGTGSESVN